MAIRAAVERAGIAGEQIDYAIVGHVLQAGAGQITSLQASIGAGLPKDVPAITINKVCPLGMSAIAMADQMIRRRDRGRRGGRHGVDDRRYVLPKARDGSRLGDAELIDTMIHDGLWSSFLDQHMGEGTDEVSAELGLTREEQDRWAARSHGAPPPPGTRVGWPTRSWRSRSAAEGAWHRRPRRGSGPTRRRKRWPPCAPRSAGRDDHRGQRVADLRRRLRGRRDERREGGGARRRADRRDRRLRDVVRPVSVAAHGAGDRAGARDEEGRARDADLGLVEINEAFAAVPIHPRACSASTRTS